jgi:hypothetical protein
MSAVISIIPIMAIALAIIICVPLFVLIAKRILKKILIIIPIFVIVIALAIFIVPLLANGEWQGIGGFLGGADDDECPPPTPEGGGLGDTETPPVSYVPFYYSVNEDGETCTITGPGNAMEPYLNIPDTVDGYRVTAIANSAFSYCDELRGVVLPDSLESIGSQAFYYCGNLLTVRIGENLSNIEYNAFRYCDRLVEIIDHSPNIEATAGEGKYETGYISERALEVHTGEESRLIYIDDYVWYQTSNTYLVSYEGNDDVITLPEDFYGSSYIIYNLAFRLNPDIREIYLTNGVIEVCSGTFDDCDNIERIFISASVEKFSVISLQSCKKLLGITCDSENPYYTSYEDNLYSKDGKKIIKYASGKSAESFTVPTGVTVIGEVAFAHAENLRSVSLPESVTMIESSAFINCRKLNTVNIPAATKYIGEAAFYITPLSSATFGSKSGWKFLLNYSNVTYISPSDLSDTATAANYLRQKYSVAGYWYK